MTMAFETEKSSLGTAHNEYKYAKDAEVRELMDKSIGINDWLM